MATIHKVRLTEATEEYARYNTARGLKINSVRNQSDVLRPMAREIGDIYVCNVTALHLERFLGSKDWKANTRNVKIGHLRNFFKWCDQRGYKDPRVDLMYGWHNLRVPKTDRLRIPAHEWQRLFDACTYPTETAAIAVGLFTFVRVSEARRIRVGDVHFHSDTISIYRVKTETYDELPMSAELSGYLRPYLVWYAEDLASRGIPMKDSHYLIPPRIAWTIQWTAGGGHIDPTRINTNVGRTVKDVVLRAGFDRAFDEEGLGLHTLRRSGARALFDRLVDDGYDGALKTVQAMLGHATGQMTEKYLGIELDKKKRNDLLAGKPMFPGLHASNVTTLPLREAR